jgi:hypothetical protein
MTSQWVEPGGGIPAWAMSGRKLVNILCKRVGKICHNEILMTFDFPDIINRILCIS